MTSRTVAQKMGIKQGWTAHLVHPPEGVLDSLGLPELDWVEQPLGTMDYIHLFVVTREQMTREFPRYVPPLAPRGKLWLSWPKTGHLGSDLRLPIVIEIGYEHGLVESTCLRIDAVWAGLRFTHPKKGKTYQNSHGILPSQR